MGKKKADGTAMSLQNASNAPQMPAFPDTGGQGANAFGTGDLVPKSINVDIPVAIQAVLPPGFSGGTAWSRTTFVMPIDTEATKTVMGKRIEYASKLELLQERLANAWATITDLKKRLLGSGEDKTQE